MENQNQAKTIGIVVLVAVAAGVGFYLLAKASDKRRRKELEERLGEQSSGNVLADVLSNIFGKKSSKATGSLNLGDYKFTKFPMKNGSKGEDVKQLQLLLLKYDKNILAPHGATGGFYGLTENALKKIIGKTTVDSQSDIDLLKSKIQEKINYLTGIVGMNIAGIPIRSK